MGLIKKKRNGNAFYINRKVVMIFHIKRIKFQYVVLMKLVMNKFGVQIVVILLIFLSQSL